MKKRSGFIIALVLLCVSLGLSACLNENLGEISINEAIEENKPSQEELSEFYSRLEDDTYFYYNNLNDDKKEAYITLYVSVMNFDESIYLDISEDSIEDVFTSVLFDNPHIFWVNNGYSYKEHDKGIIFSPEYRHTIEEADTITNELNKKIDEIVSEVELLSSEYEKELYIHDYVCENTAYDFDIGEFTDTAYEALLNGNAVCEGYSRAIQILLNAVDIDNYLIVGNGISEGKIEPHMWNVVNIDNANYHLDATWNDSDEGITYFYFNVTDEYILKNHTDLNITNNGCGYNTANYFVMENLYVSDYNGFDEHTDRCALALKNGKNTIEFYFNDPDDFKEAINDIENGNDFFQFVSSTVYQSGRDLDLQEIEYYTYDTFNYLCIAFKER